MTSTSYCQSPMRIAITGVTSYTGTCIAEALAKRAHHVSGLARDSIQSYTGLKRNRLERAASAGVELVGSLPGDGDAMRDWASDRLLDVWIHHHHPMDGYRRPDYEVERIRALMLRSSRSLVRELAARGTRLFIYSGTYFEPGEGGQSPDARTTPYASLKRELSIELERLCADSQIRFAKVVLPWPVGALENEDRLTPLLIRAAEQRRAFTLLSPDSIMDVLPGDAVGDRYSQIIDQMLGETTSPRSHTFRPSGRVISTFDWSELVRTEILRPLQLGEALTVSVPPPGERAAPVAFENPAGERLQIDWAEFAARYVRDWRAFK